MVTEGMRPTARKPNQSASFDRRLVHLCESACIRGRENFCYPNRRAAEQIVATSASVNSG